jgi:CHAP domain
MPETVDDHVELDEQIQEVTEEEGQRDPRLLADPKTASEGVLDDEDPPKFQEFERQITEAIVLEDDTHSGAGGAGASISRHLQRALQLGVSQKGVRETPPGSNCQIYSRYFGFGCQFWCADFVAYCLDRTGNQDKRVPWGPPSAVANITAWGQRHGLIHNTPQKGDIFTRKDHMHTGLVLSAQGSSFMTIEGNTSGPMGDVYVASHARDASSGLYFFVRHHF